MRLMRTGAPLLVAASVLGLGSQSAVAADSASDAGSSDSASAATPASEVVITGQQPSDVAASGTKSETPLIETPQSITVIDRQDLDLRVVQNLNEALHFTAGVGPDTRGNTAGRYDLQTIRGFTPDQYLDGLRLIGSANGYATPQVDLAF